MNSETFDYIKEQNTIESEKEQQQEEELNKKNEDIFDQADELAKESEEHQGQERCGGCGIWFPYSKLCTTEKGREILCGSCYKTRVL